MKLAAWMLCDAASVREDLLHVLGGGITRLDRSFPAKMNLTLAMLFQSEPGDETRSYDCNLRIKADDGDELSRISFEIVGESSEKIQDWEPATIPAVVSLHDTTLPKPGIYFLEFTFNEGEPLTYSFVAK